MQLLENIKTEILKDNNFKSCSIYEPVRGAIAAPAVFLEISGYSAGSDPATGELALIANIDARVVVDAVSANADVICQGLACKVAEIAHLNSFGIDVTPGAVVGISRDAFKPEFDAYICWLVEWSHEFHVGTSIWNDNEALPPHELFINGGINGQ